MPEDFEGKFMQSPAQRQEEKKDPEGSSAQVESPGSIEPSPGVAPVRTTHAEKWPLWDEFRGGEVDEVGEYKEPSPEQKSRFEKRLERVSEIFENASFQWYLDGAINISLYIGTQIRDHKDLDISVFQEDLPKLDELLVRQGFDIFVNYDENGERLMRKVTVEEIAALGKPDLSICKIGSDGKIERESQDPFNFVDLHILSKDSKGNIIISYNGATLSKEFFKPVKKELPNGKGVYLSQPVIVAYHKFHSNRPHDLTDLQRLRPRLQKEDFRMLRESSEREVEEAEKIAIEKLQEVWSFLRPILESAQNQKAISEKLWEHPDLQKRRNDQKISGFIFSISQYVSENPSVTFEDFLSWSLAVLRPREQIERILGAINQLEES